MEEAQAVEQPTETPMPVEESAPSQEGETGTEEEKPKSVNRFQKLASENKRFREELGKLKSESQTLEGARNLDQWLRANPKNLRVIMDLMEGKAPQVEPQKDPYADFAPDVAERFKKLDAIAKRFEEEDRQKQESQARTIEENKAHLESIFESKLKSDGFIQKDGTYDQNEIDLLADAVLSRITRIARDPHKPTEQELNTAYSQIVQGTQAFEKRGLKKTIKPSVPQSGSNKGSIPIGKTSESDEERVLRIARELE